MLCVNLIICFANFAYSWVFFLVLRGLGRQRLVFWLAILGFWVLGVPIGAILTFAAGLGVVGIWWGFTIGIYLTSLIGFWCFRRVDWDHEARKSEKRLSLTHRVLAPIGVSNKDDDPE